MGIDNKVSVSDLVSSVDAKTSCICYFGGDPSPQLIHSINAGKTAMKKSKGRILRICWETSGSMNTGLLSRMVDISLESRGCIKFDLKAWTEELRLALCGASNKRTLEKFSIIARHVHKKPEAPLLVASTLLVPGYIDREEVYRIASFIYRCCPDIPYTLLGFSPHFLMADLPRTTRTQADECFNAAKEAGLNHVKIGNEHLLS